MSPWWQRRKRGQSDLGTGLDEAKAAYKKSIQDRERTEELIKEVKPLVREIKKHQQINHFTELFEQAYRGERGQQS